MRLLLEIAIIILAGVAIYFITTQKNDTISNFKDQNEMQQDSIQQLNEKLSKRSELNDSLKQTAKKIEKEELELQQNLAETKQTYNDSLKEMKEKSMDELVGDTTRMTSDSAYVVVDTSRYRQMRENEIEMKKLDAQLGICRERMKRKDRLIQLKDMRIDNYKTMITVHKNKIEQKNGIIDNKDNQIRMLKNKVKRKNLEMWGIGSGAAIIIGTIILL